MRLRTHWGLTSQSLRTCLLVIAVVSIYVPTETYGQQSAESLPMPRPEQFIQSPLDLPSVDATTQAPFSPGPIESAPIQSTPVETTPIYNGPIAGDSLPGPVPSGPASSFPLMEPPFSAPSVEVTDRAPPVVESPRRKRLSRLEKLLDGGDRFPKVRVRDDWTVQGLDPEDTIAHYDTLDGRTEVSASNQVAIYAPRFAAVRQVKNVYSSESVIPAGRIRTMAALNESESHDFADMVKFDDSAIEHIYDLPAQALEDRAPGRTVKTVDAPTPTLGHRPAFVATQITNTDELFEDRLAFDETYTQELVIDNKIKSVRINLDSRPASVISETSGANEVLEYKLPEGKARVRVLKLASAKAARAGDTVRFTIRFDNVGDEAVGNVTIMDNLTTRFVYIPDSETCDIKAEFKTEPNDQQSKILRWEIDEPIEPGHGGIIRFDCRVR